MILSQEAGEDDFGPSTAQGAETTSGPRPRWYNQRMLKPLIDACIEFWRALRGIAPPGPQYRPTGFRPQAISATCASAAGRPHDNVRDIYSLTAEAEAQ